IHLHRRRAAAGRRPRPGRGAVPARRRRRHRAGLWHHRVDGQGGGGRREHRRRGGRRMTVFHGLGPVPGTDVRAVAEILAGETGAMPHLPILPARGLGSDAVGRTAALCVDLSVDRGARSWRITDRPGHAQRVAADHVERDLDVCEEFWGTGPDTVVVPVTGPWTLAASLELAGGHRMLTDGGAVTYLAESLAAGVADHV